MIHATESRLLFAVYFCAALCIIGCTEAEPHQENSFKEVPENISETQTPPDQKPASDPDKNTDNNPHTPATDNPDQTKEPSEPPPEPSPVTLGAGTTLSLSPVPPEPEPPGRVRRRMDVDQLDQAMRTVAGGIGWTSDTGENNFEALAGSMGKPDYLNSVMEDLSPSPLFQKFLEDASRDVCNKLMTLEVEQAAQVPILFTHITPELSPLDAPDAVEENLRALLLRFHGRVLPAGSPGLEHWKWLVNSSYVITKDPALTWRTVCVGLFVHPDFYSY